MAARVERMERCLHQKEAKAGKQSTALSSDLLPLDHQMVLPTLEACPSPQLIFPGRGLTGVLSGVSLRWSHVRSGWRWGLTIHKNCPMSFSDPCLGLPDGPWNTWGHRKEEIVSHIQAPLGCVGDPLQNCTCPDQAPQCPSFFHFRDVLPPVSFTKDKVN